ncbi:hypothetical protein CLV65_0028 [Pseudoscardovia suis]|uniref:Uncharacterized protein n=1 Tax=Pseudoscardovia suis TaxID=987063 RepID=A0A261EYX7_9BIFI|nr:hypothetical protein PSSU_0853 [Pseudoscardovia suis]PJJ69331.1 hypothetical protein CLV65_0028 [Pseudoscardovia suis]
MKTNPLTSVFGDTCPNPAVTLPLPMPPPNPHPLPTTHRRVSCGTPRMLV